MMERVTMIHADQWELVAEDVKAGRCEVLDYTDDAVTCITKKQRDTYTITNNPDDDTWEANVSSTFTVRWLDTAQTERDAEAGYAAAGEDILYTKFQALLIERNSLQAERDALASKLAAAVEMATVARKEIAELFDPEQRFDRSKDGRFVTETLNFADASLMLIEGIVKGTATPQPAPAVDGGQVGKYVVCHECDGTGKLFVPETLPAALPELDSDGQSAPANSELVAAVKQFTFMTALRRLENGMDTLQVSSQFANSEWIEAFRHMHKCMEDAAAALKGE